MFASTAVDDKRVDLSGGSLPVPPPRVLQPKIFDT
jgi:hypothetical protein